MFKVFVYGTLLSGEHNNRRYLQNEESKLLGEDNIMGFIMYSLGAFPAIVEAAFEEEGMIIGEVWEISDNVLKRLDYLEGYPDFYNRMEVNTKFGSAYVYYQIDKPNGKLIESGSWKEYLGR